jgi:glycerol-3-phosphate dehydrogenase
LNYAKVRRILLDGKAVRGVEIEDRLTGECHEIQADRVCNCTGSWARALAAQHDREHAQLFIPSLAFNVLFDCERPSDDALAVAAPDPGAPVYFLCPSPFGLFVGTEHVGRPDDCSDAEVTEGELLAFIGRLNRGIPSLNLTLRSIRHVFSGLLPVRVPEGVKLTAREVIVDHAQQGGPTRLYSVTGIKFTTARKVGARALDQILGAGDARAHPVPDAPKVSWATKWLLDGVATRDMPGEEAVRMIRDVAAEESAVSAEDFWLRRTNWVFTGQEIPALARLTERAVGRSNAA